MAAVVFFSRTRGFGGKVWRMNSRLRFFFFFFKVEISLRTPIPLFRPGSVHSGWASWDDCGRACTAASAGTWTRNLSMTSPSLYQLSYSDLPLILMMHYDKVYVFTVVYFKQNRKIFSILLFLWIVMVGEGIGPVMLITVIIVNLPSSPTIPTFHSPNLPSVPLICHPILEIVFTSFLNCVVK